MTNPLWTERYRPSKVSDVVLPDSLKDQFESMVKSGEVPNLILSGPPGVGKTTMALAMLDELGYDSYLINGSLKGNIDTLRNEIMDFASSVSFSGKRKVVLIDEADYLNPQSTQPALRNFMEEYSGNCGFILTCNFKNRIIEPLRSRCSVIDFQIKKSDRSEMMKTFFKRVSDILDKEGIEYDPQVVGHVINRHFPDWRRVLNELQRYSSIGKIDNGILARTGEEDFKRLVGLMASKDFGGMREWVGEHGDMDHTLFFRKFYDHAAEWFTDDSVPQLILTIGEYQYKASHVADQEINIVAFLVHVMATCSLRS